MLLFIMRLLFISFILMTFGVGHLFFRDEKRKILFSRQMAKWVLKVLNIQVISNDDLPRDPHLIVANHISWLDPLIMLDLISIQFITHTEVKNHPFLGWITRLGLCHFWNREGRQLKKEVHQASKALNHHSLGIYPEGTSHNGFDLLDFKSAPFEIAIQSQKNIVPLYISYVSVNGDRYNPQNHNQIAYYGEMTFFESFWNILKNTETIVHVQAADIIQSSEYTSRKELRDKAQKIIEGLHYKYGPYQKDFNMTLSEFETALHFPLKS